MNGSKPAEEAPVHDDDRDAPPRPEEVREPRDGDRLVRERLGRDHKIFAGRRDAVDRVEPTRDAPRAVDVERVEHAAVFHAVVVKTFRLRESSVSHGLDASSCAGGNQPEHVGVPDVVPLVPGARAGLRGISA